MFTPHVTDDSRPPLRHLDRFTELWDPASYSGQAWIALSATQLEDDEARTAAQKRRILDGWIDLLSAGDAPITHLYLCSRVPQRLLDAVSGLPDLRYLAVKWGPYEDLGPLSDLHLIEALRLGGATRVTTLAPLRLLPDLVEVDLSNAFRLADFSELGDLTALRYLTLGTGIGTDRLLHIPDLEWVRPLRHLHWFHLPGATIDSADLSPAADLPELAYFGAPLRSTWRSQVMALAECNPAFLDMAMEYQALEKG
ncbi:hypothetical protein [Brachybacterium paraconglomeratum]|uniref:hypothetical protein n=1 Tax=Brachybacterium paraconglomeratum TaxID=173362 RepID=UPI0022AF7897|nr:hypothetical protein [Brachybacterium paraconglomeratum]MCZ4325486.1 hypothetical protein [Brachybacterium paraconglomeratum]